LSKDLLRIETRIRELLAKDFDMPPRAARIVTGNISVATMLESQMET